MKEEKIWSEIVNLLNSGFDKVKLHVERKTYIGSKKRGTVEFDTYIKPKKAVKE